MAGCFEHTDAERVTVYAGHGPFLTCSALGESITEAVLEGEVPVVDEACAAST
jgi:hypothetical protein